MARKKFKYYPLEDVLFIKLSKEKSYTGDEEYQTGVVLFRDTQNPESVVTIEILNFSSFKENKIFIAKDKSLDFSRNFEGIRKKI
ncbi:DUF2283 domain-containing protein [Bacteroidota bacterium]